MSTVWSTRSTGYKVGVGGMYFSAFLYLLGFSLPYWIEVKNFSYYGLWLICGQSDYRTVCVSMVRSTTASWYQAIQTLEALGLIVLIIPGLYALYINCRIAPYSHNRVVEALSAVSGVLGIIACMIFVGKTQEVSSKSAEYYSGGFATNLTGSILLVIFAAVIANGNNPSTAQQASAGVVFHPGVVTTTQAMPPGTVAYPPPAAAYGYDQRAAVGGQYPAGYGYPAPAQAGYPAGYPAPAAAPAQDVK